MHRMLAEREERLALLNGELTHRIKNLFALTTSVLLQTIRTSASLQDAAKAIVRRLQAIAAAQELSTATGDGIDLRSLLDRIVRPMAPTPDRVVVDGPDAVVSGTDATSFSLLLHELAANAIKHGAWASGNGLVQVTWAASASALEFVWIEKGAQIVKPSVHPASRAR